MTEEPAGTDRIVLEETLMSINGFEEIAISKAFGERLARMHETMACRAALFVLDIRAGQKPKDAYHSAMLLTLGDIESRINVGDETLDQSEQEERDREYAMFVVGIGVSFMPDQYRQLTAGQRAAMIEAAQKAHGR